MPSIRTRYQNNLPGPCYIKGKHLQLTPMYSEDEWLKCSNAQSAKILSYANCMQSDEASLTSSRACLITVKEGITFAPNLMLSTCILFYSNYG